MKADIDELIKAVKVLTLELQKVDASRFTDSAAQIILSIVPLLGVVLGVTMLFFFLLWRYKITKELIKSGHYTRTTFRNFRGFSLLLGCISAAAGLPMTILFYALEGTSYLLLGGVLPLAAGIGLVVFVFLSKSFMED